MARSGKRGSGDRVLESRHLVGVFLGVVLLCGVFFTLGYVMGRAQYGGPVHASESTLRTAPALPAPVRTRPGDASSARSTGEWDFYTNRHENRLEPPVTVKPPLADPPRLPSAAPKASGTASPEAAAVGTPVRHGPPVMPSGSLLLQVAAVTRSSDALAMADALGQKGFPSFVTAPTTDNFYRVQVGPYRDDRAAESAKGALGRAGFKAIIKR
jgi:DedD protein